MNETSKNKAFPAIEESWKKILKAAFCSDYFLNLTGFLEEEKSKFIIYPPCSQIFNAFNLTPFDKVKVVIIGQDPYHGPGQADGLCFSVPPGIKKPPSLVNIFKELNQDLGMPMPESGNLNSWAKQGVLLLNSVLTVRAGQPGSHQNKGWEKFTDAAIAAVSAEKTGVVFLLWGAFAKAKAELIDESKHHVLTAAHPSPFSAYRGFFGCRHFSKTNEILINQAEKEIDWAIDNRKTKFSFITS